MAKKKKEPKSREKNQKVSVFFFPGDPNRVDPSMLEAFPEHAKLIACIIAEWVQIEHKLAMFVALRLETDGQIIFPMVYAIETSRARFEMMSAALRGLIEPGTRGAAKLEQLLKEIGQLLVLRNRYAHAHFGRDADSDDLAIVSSSKKKATINIPVHELTYHFDRMKRVSHTLALIVAAELGLPLKGPDATESVPAHPLAIRAARIDRARSAPPPPSPPSPEASGPESS